MERARKFDHFTGDDSGLDHEWRAEIYKEQIVEQDTLEQSEGEETWQQQ